MKRIFIVFPLIFFLIALPLLHYEFFVPKSLKSETPEVFVGVDVAYDNLVEIENLVDEISSYTNTLVIGSTGITFNNTKLNEVCNYVYDRGMYFMIYMHPNPNQLDEQRQWIENAGEKWPKNFIGLYTYDEPGGRVLDRDEFRIIIDEASNYTDAEDKYVTELNKILQHTIEEALNSGNSTLFTSDYAFYWFDYKGGYDVVFAEFGWNYSRQLNVALDRGAATVQNKDWGVMITWTYNNPPYLESGEELYSDLILAYNNGAKYILVFDTNLDYTHGVLEDEHLDALKQFWQYMKDNPRNEVPISDRIAYVLPKGYAYGFRGPYDKIWGLWEGDADSFSYELSVDLGGYLEQYSDRLDIIYINGLEIDNTYSKYIFWNGTTYIP
jgi:hypothetical protein